MPRPSKKSSPATQTNGTNKTLTDDEKSVADTQSIVKNEEESGSGPVFRFMSIFSGQNWIREQQKKTSSAVGNSNISRSSELDFRPDNARSYEIEHEYLKLFYIYQSYRHPEESAKFLADYFTMVPEVSSDGSDVIFCDIRPEVELEIKSDKYLWDRLHNEALSTFSQGAAQEQCEERNNNYHHYEVSPFGIFERVLLTPKLRKIFSRFLELNIDEKDLRQFDELSDKLDVAEALLFLRKAASVQLPEVLYPEDSERSGLRGSTADVINWWNNHYAPAARVGLLTTTFISKHDRRFEGRLRRVLSSGDAPQFKGINTIAKLIEHEGGERRLRAMAATLLSVDEEKAEQLFGSLLSRRPNTGGALHRRKRSPV